MLYYQPYAAPADETLVAAWDSELARLSEFPDVASKVSTTIFPRFAAHYARIRSLPRGARRALVRKLVRSSRYGAPAAKRLARTAAGAALLLALAQGAEAATINVTTNVPDISADGKCSLIEAIINANDDAATHPDCAAGSGADTIVLPKKSTHTLTTFYGSPPALRGLPGITSAITIEGNGATIVGHSFLVTFPVDASGDLTLKNLTARSGRFAATNAGSLTIQNSTIANNGNTAIYFQGFFINGGGVYNSGSLTVVQTTISGNFSNGEQTVRGFGGGIKNSGSATIEQSTIAQNRAETAAAISNSGTMTIENTTVSGNAAANQRISPPGVLGGAINNAGLLRIVNSTISGNSATALAPFADALGGAIYNSGDLSVESSTVSGNTAAATNVTYLGDALGGGIFNGTSVGGGSLNLDRSLVSGNHAATAGREVYNRASISVDDFNLFGYNGDAGVVGFTPGASDIVPAAGVALNDILAPLKDNGGPTETHALVKRSPAIDATPVDSACPAEDQRGVTRPVGDGCDIGSFEFTKGKGKAKGKNK
jgi:hypothetical protein